MKRNDTFGNSKRLAVSAMLCAVSFALMYFGALTGVFDLCAVAIGAVGTAFAVIEMNGIYPWLIAAVTGTLCFLFLPDKFVAMEYIVLGGFYPIFKAYFERIKGKVFQWILKMVFFNVLFAASLAIAKFVIGMTDDYIEFKIVIFGIANAYFVIYDIALTVLISYYVQKLRKKMKIDL